MVCSAVVQNQQDFPFLISPIEAVRKQLTSHPGVSVMSVLYRDVCSETTRFLRLPSYERKAFLSTVHVTTKKNSYTKLTVVPASAPLASN